VFNRNTTPLITHTHTTQLPIYSLMAFGSYSLFVIGYKLFVFPDCPEASEELREEVSVCV
jgi:hypothetical protein